MSEIALAGWATMRLDILPEVVIRQLENARKECEQTTVDRLCEVIGKGFDLVHEGVQAGGHAVDVLPVGSIPVELLDTINWSTVALCEIKGQNKPTRRSIV
jgi:hypothetical protein